MCFVIYRDGVSIIIILITLAVRYTFFLDFSHERSQKGYLSAARPSWGFSWYFYQRVEAVIFSNALVGGIRHRLWAPEPPAPGRSYFLPLHSRRSGLHHLVVLFVATKFTGNWPSGIGPLSITLGVCLLNHYRKWSPSVTTEGDHCLIIVRYSALIFVR